MLMKLYEKNSFLRKSDVLSNAEEKYFELAGKIFREGDGLSLDGSTGNIYDTIIKTVPADPNSGYFGRIMRLADKYKAMDVRTNADTPADAKRAAELGAQGIGLVRTEHMFFGPGRIDKFREMICSETVEERHKIVFIGDYAQLPPVGMAISPALSSEYLSHNYGIKTTEAVLTEIVRQDSGAIIENAIAG